MKSPVVSRATYEAVERRALHAESMWQQEAQRATECDERWERRFEALQAQYAALVERITASPVPAASPAPLPPPPHPLSLIAQAIRDEARGDRRLADYFRKRAAELRREHPGMSDEQIALELRSWQTSEPEYTAEMGVSA